MSDPADPQQQKRPGAATVVLVVMGLIIGVAVGALILMPVAPGPRQPVATAAAPTTSLGVTPAGFSAMRLGMTYEEAVAILGAPDSSAFDPSGEARTVDWSSGGNAHITAIFMRNRLIARDQVNVQPGKSTDLYNKVHDCQAAASSCSDDCDADWKQCVGEPGTPPPQHCSDDVEACRETCAQQLRQCSQ